MKIEIDNCYNMDCLDGMRLMKEQGLKADWCITDPPYGICVTNNMGRRKGDKASECKEALWDRQDRFLCAKAYNRMIREQRK